MFNFDTVNGETKIKLDYVKILKLMVDYSKGSENITKEFMN